MTKSDIGRKSKSPKPEKQVGKEVVYLNLDLDIVNDLKEDAKASMRPISVQAAYILKQHYESKKKSK